MFFLYVGTVLVGLPAILLFPTFLPHVLTFVINRRRIKGRIGAASFKFQWPGLPAHAAPVYALSHVPARTCPCAARLTRYGALHHRRLRPLAQAL